MRKKSSSRLDSCIHRLGLRSQVRDHVTVPPVLVKLLQRLATGIEVGECSQLIHPANLCLEPVSISEPVESLRPVPTSLPPADTIGEAAVLPLPSLARGLARWAVPKSRALGSGASRTPRRPTTLLRKVS